MLARQQEDHAVNVVHDELKLGVKFDVDDRET